MARLTLQQALRVAELSALSLDEREAEAMCHDLGSILEHMAALERLDVTGVEPTYHPVPPPQTLRADVVLPSIDRDALLRAAPASEEGAFAVPKVLDGDG